MTQLQHPSTNENSQAWWLLLVPLVLGSVETGETLELIWLINVDKVEFQVVRDLVSKIR